MNLEDENSVSLSLPHTFSNCLLRLKTFVGNPGKIEKKSNGQPLLQTVVLGSLLSSSSTFVRSRRSFLTEMAAQLSAAFFPQRQFC